MNIALFTQKLDCNDYVFGFFYGHIIDLAAVCETVHVVCLEKRDCGTLPPNVIVHSLGKEDGVGKWTYIGRLFAFLFSGKYQYDTVFVYMEPLYVLLCGWWWRITGKQVFLWYNHVYVDLKLRLARLFVHTIIGVSKEGVPVAHPHIVHVTYERDLTAVLTQK